MREKRLRIRGRRLLDSVAVTEMIAKLPGLEDLEDRHARAIVVSRASAAMEADFLSLMRMFDSPTEMKLRAPILIRDIYSLLLLGKMGEGIRSMFTQTGRSGRVTQAVSWLRTNYRSAFTIEELAERAFVRVLGRQKCSTKSGSVWAKPSA